MPPAPPPRPRADTVPDRTTAPADRVEVLVTRMLSTGAVIAVVLLVIGTVLMIGGGTSPDATTYPALHPARLIDDILALRPEGFLWAGILVVIATPIVRVIGELIGFAMRRDRVMALVAASTLLVIGVSVVSALAAEA